MAVLRRAVLVYEDKRLIEGGFILQGRVWLVPEAVVGSRHSYKYSLFFGRSGERLVLYDNEREKGDHRHYGSHEEPYGFVGLEQLLRDFMSDVARVAGRPDLFHPKRDER